MISKAQSNRCTPQPSFRQKPSLSALDKGLLRWTLAERGDKVLDACISNGLLLEYLQRNMECEVCGVSDDMECVRTSRTRLRNADIIFSSQAEIPWRENTFDTVLVKLNNQLLSKSQMLEVLRVLKPGGQLLLGSKTVPRIFRPLELLWSKKEEEGSLPKARAQAMEQMQQLGLSQIFWQQTDLFHGVCVGWKPIEF